MRSAPPSREERPRGRGESAARGASAACARAASRAPGGAAPVASRRARRRGRAGCRRALVPFTRGAASSGAVGSAGTDSPPGAARSGSATVAAHVCAAGSASSSARVRAAWASDCWPSSQSAISPARVGGGRSGARPASAVARAGADRLLGHPEQVGELAVGASLAEDELHGGALVWRQPVERGGAAARRHRPA